ncbi:uncharacterized protein LOC109832700 isoform X3 [Asparagus officinalis]|uniref:uncharacterized protein LOC109832700 isoform X3 n=1 Tax=Asparagus officinalis TaxID=4686 RepID=UPI00098E23D1|nr:uncharacterized protein LOC109832700 isoform X3 [Asparagus officinalis]
MASPNSKTLTLKPSASTSFTEERLREYNRRRQASSSSNPYLYLRSLGLSPGRESFASSARTSASSSSVLLMIQEWTPSCLLLLHCFEITVVSLSLSLSLSLFLRQIRMNLGVSGEMQHCLNQDPLRYVGDMLGWLHQLIYPHHQCRHRKLPIGLHERFSVKERR